MKLTKLASLAVAAAFVLSVSSAKAFVGTVQNYSVLNVSVVVKTNLPHTTVGSIEKWADGVAKFTNKDLLDLFASANWADMTFPAGAKLVIGWDSPWNSQVLVVDKTGTNVIYAVPNSGTQNFYVEFDYESGNYTETYNSADPGFDTWTEMYMQYVQLEDDASNTYLWGYPTGKQTFLQKWDVNGDGTVWSDVEVINLGGGMGGDQEVNNNSNGSVSGSITAVGHGTGYNPWWY